MFPGMGMNPKQMQKIMQQLGINMTDIDASEVIIKTSSGDIIVSNPKVTKMKVQGQETFQVVGQVSEGDEEAVSASDSSEEVEISEEDVKMVMDQTGVSEEKAKEALENAGGDLAKAILELTE